MSEHFDTQITLQLGMEKDYVDWDLDAVPYQRAPVNLSEAIHTARKIAEGMADTMQGQIVRVTVVHYPNGSGEPNFYDTDGNEVNK